MNLLSGAQNSEVLNLHSSHIGVDNPKLFDILTLCKVLVYSHKNFKVV